MSEKTVTLTTKEYNSLLEDRYWRMAFENAGVDNWQWYSEAISEYYDMLNDSEGK